MAFYSAGYGYNVVAMKKIILHLLLILSIAVVPLQQAFPMPADSDMSAMDTMSSNCINCDHQDSNNSSCMGDGCINQALNCSTTGIVLFLTESTSSFNPVDVSNRLALVYPSRYYSQITKPDLRPPIARRAPLKIVFSHDSSVSSVLESSCMPYTLRFCARCFLALTKKS